MNTTFKILWFEDEPAWFNMEKLRIEEILRTHYLIPVIERRDGDDFDLEELTGNDYDLIFMDYKLAEGKTGDTIVAAIRNSYILTDILFYSSEEQNMLSAIRKQMPPIDGVYLTKRDYRIFTEKAERIIQKIVKRSEDVVNLRGFVLDNTSAFEVRIREILNICWQKFKPEHKVVLSEAIEKQLENKSARVETQIKAAKAGFDNLQTFIASTIDAMLFAQSFCNAAEEKGLGICYLGTTAYNADQIIEALSLPRLVVPIVTVTVGYPAEPIPAQVERLPLAAVVQNETYTDFTPASIDALYSEKEALEVNKQFVRENNKETLAQVFTDVRYTKKNSEHFSEVLLKVLKQQGFMK